MHFEILLNNSQKVGSENLLDVTMTDIWQVEKNCPSNSRKGPAASDIQPCSRTHDSEVRVRVRG
jgi:hypothetical protein